MASDIRGFFPGEVCLLNQWLKDIYYHIDQIAKENSTGEVFQSGNAEVLNQCFEVVAVLLLENALKDERMQDPKQMTRAVLCEKFWRPLDSGDLFYNTVRQISMTEKSKEEAEKIITRHVSKWLVLKSSSSYDNRELFFFKERLWTEIFPC